MVKIDYVKLFGGGVNMAKKGSYKHTDQAVWINASLFEKTLEKATDNNTMRIGNNSKCMQRYSPKSERDVQLLRRTFGSSHNAVVVVVKKADESTENASREEVLLIGPKGPGDGTTPPPNQHFEYFENVRKHLRVRPRDSSRKNKKKRK